MLQRIWCSHVILDVEPGEFVVVLSCRIYIEHADHLTVSGLQNVFDPLDLHPLDRYLCSNRSHGHLLFLTLQQILDQCVKILIQIPAKRDRLHVKVGNLLTLLDVYITVCLLDLALEGFVHLEGVPAAIVIHLHVVSGRCAGGYGLAEESDAVSSYNRFPP